MDVLSRPRTALTRCQGRGVGERQTRFKHCRAATSICDAGVLIGMIKKDPIAPGQVPVSRYCRVPYPVPAEIG